ncbi:MAG: aldehyde ferredoxin oxidoreductase family protein [Bellilinea sp.]|nr:aldehyde ferredoxin oxidoreductase family protein [Bellilinea sp.]
MVKINLSNRQIQREQLPLEWIEGFIGASGLAARILWDGLDVNRPPLDPNNPLLFATGPLTGTGGPTTGRFTICGRSPQTGWWGESNIGGFVGPELRYAGIDFLWIEGASDTPVYIWIYNDRIEIRPAEHLWGKADTYETQQIIRQEVGIPQAKVACIGLAGENLVPFAGILSDHGRLAARTGMGALMGSKKLKAVAVRGTQRLVMGRDEEYRKLRVASNKRLLEQNMTAVLRTTGTSGGAEYLQYLGDMPQKYWTAARFEGAEKISGATMAETILKGTSACQGCVISCGREVEIAEGDYPTNGVVKGPEYETICSFGSQLMVDDLAAITALGDLCDRLGMDTITAGNVIALAYLLFDQGKLTPKDTGGLQLRWGDPVPGFTLLKQMATKEGFGNLLSQGSKALAAAYGDEDLAVQVNGLDVAMHDPRAFSGQALVYVTSPRGACHNQSDYFNVGLGGTVDEIGIGFTDRFDPLGKGEQVARHQHWRTVCNSLTTCFFAVVSPNEILGLLNAAMDWDWDVLTLLKAGERAWNMKRLYNLKLGWKPENEKLPKLLLQPLMDGGQEGNVPNLSVMLDEYYRCSGWDRTTGYPLPWKLKELGLDDLIK